LSNLYRALSERDKRLWRQDDEWHFVRLLGSFASQSRHEWNARAPSRLELLKGYREGLLLRTDFANLDPKALLEAVDGEIALEERKNVHAKPS
jgi:hypothetical protein